MRIYLLLVVFLGLGSMASASTTLNFVGINLGSIDQKFSDVHFAARGNNFMGSIFWLNAKNIEAGETITISGGGSKTCYKQVRGIYYNAQRGSRLRPMDNDTLVYFRNISNAGYEDLTITGGLYTSCSGDEYSMYGQITYQVSGDSYNSHLVAGTKYNWNQNTISGAFSKSFQRFDNKYPIGFIYDDRGGGIGFVGNFSGAGGNSSDYANLITNLNNGSGINNLFSYQGQNNSSINGHGINISTNRGSAINTLMNAGIQGTIGLSFSVNTVEKNTLLGNFDRKTLMFNALNINFAKLINTVRKNAEDMCKGKYVNGSTVNFSQGNLFCIDFSLGTDKFISIQDHERQYLKNKILVVKGGDIRIQGAMTAGEGPVSIFIDKGNLLIGTGITKTNFDANGYPISSSGVTQGINLQGNFIVNGLILGANASRGKAAFANKLFIGGKVASLNTPSYASQGRKDQVKNVIGSGYDDRIWLGKIFTRECDPISGSGSDLVNCNNPNDKNATLPLVIIDRYYPSALIK